MFSVIIPTIWKSEYTLDLLKAYQDSDLVQEIILINNAPKETPSNFVEYSKIVHHKTKNIYVNPAWNLGVEMAKNENMLISNDDVLFDVDAALAHVKSLEDYGAIGVNPISYDQKPTKFALENKHYITKGWGCLIFVKKSKWVDIPNDLKIWFGDDWIVKKINPIQSLSVKGGIVTKIATSSGSREMRDIVTQDRFNWSKYRR